MTDNCLLIMKLERHPNLSGLLTLQTAPWDFYW